MSRCHNVTTSRRYDVRQSRDVTTARQRAAWKGCFKGEEARRGKKDKGGYTRKENNRRYYVRGGTLTFTVVEGIHPLNDLESNWFYFRQKDPTLARRSLKPLFNLESVARLSGQGLSHVCVR